MDRKYPKRFQEQLRIEIAVAQMQHDLRKLLSSINPNEWQKIDQDIAGWFSGQKFELESIHDFWNFFGGFSRGLKLKSLLSWITAENVIWDTEDVEIKDIIITWDFPGLEFMGEAPYYAKKVSQKLKNGDMKGFRQKLKLESKERSQKYVDRDGFRVILFHDPRGGVINKLSGFYILEGNRRTVKAILNENITIPAYVGRLEKDEKWPKNYWFPTGTLRDLIFLSLGYQKENDNQSYDFVRKFYQLLLRDFEISRIATFDKIFKNFENDQNLLIDIMTKDLK